MGYKTIFYPGQPVMIADAGGYPQHLHKKVVLVRSGLCENDEGDGGYVVWEVSPELCCEQGYVILWDEPALAPLDGDVLDEGMEQLIVYPPIKELTNGH